MVAQAAAPANFKTYQERKQMMSEDKPTNNFTMVPNAFLDELLNRIEHVTELKVTLAVIRQTTGYQKKTDIISYSQFQKLTGLTPSSVADGLKYALERGVVTREKVGQYWRYGLQPLAPGYQSDDATTSPRLVQPLAPGECLDQKPLAPGYTQKKEDLNKTLKSEREGAASEETAAPAAIQVVKVFDGQQSIPSSRQVEVMTAVPAGPNGHVQERTRSREPANPKIHIPSVPKPVPKNQVKGPDPNLVDPRMQMWRKYADLAGYGPWPNALQRQMILDTVPLERLARWEYYLKSWVAHGWQMRNVEDLLDLFVTGKQKRGSR